MKRAMTFLGGTAVGLVALLNYSPPLPQSTGLAVDTLDPSSTTTGTTGAAGSTGGTASGTDTTTGSTSGSTSGSSSSSSSASSAGATTTTVGDSVGTRYGPVQVAVVTDSSGKIVDVKILDYPASDRRDVAINTRALPILESETLAAQSADVDTVSGATYTSRGYAQSLQSALDKL